MKKYEVLSNPFDKNVEKILKEFEDFKKNASDLAGNAANCDILAYDCDISDDEEVIDKEIQKQKHEIYRMIYSMLISQYLFSDI